MLKNALITAHTGDITTNVGLPQGAKGAAANTIMSVGGGANALSSYNATNSLNKHPSYITYTVHIIDTTVSGESYDDADGRDIADYNASFAVGGRFYDDTFTDPATLP